MAVPEPCVTWEAPERPQVTWKKCTASDGVVSPCLVPEEFRSFLQYDIARDGYITRTENECKKEQTDGSNPGS